MHTLTGSRYKREPEPECAFKFRNIQLHTIIMNGIKMKLKTNERKSRHQNLMNVLSYASWRFDHNMNHSQPINGINMESYVPLN